MNWLHAYLSSSGTGSATAGRRRDISSSTSIGTAGRGREAASSTSIWSVTPGSAD